MNPSAPYLIRKATEGDIPSVQNVARETWAFTYEGIIPAGVQEPALASWYSAASLTRQIPVAGSLLLVAESGNDCVGFAQFVTRAEASAELTRIYVLPAHHGKGIGSALLEEGLRWLEGAGIRRLKVDVEELNPIGRAFYQRSGFKQEVTSAGTVRTQIVDGDLHAGCGLNH